MAIITMEVFERLVKRVNSKHEIYFFENKIENLLIVTNTFYFSLIIWGRRIEGIEGVLALYLWTIVSPSACPARVIMFYIIDEMIQNILLHKITYK